MRKLCTFRNELALMRMMDIPSFYGVCRFKSPLDYDRLEGERKETLFDDDFLENKMIKEFLMNRNDTKKQKAHAAYFT